MSLLRPLAEDLWVAEQPIRLLGAPLQTRMTVARLMSKTLWLHSPIRLTDALRAELEALGPVKAVVAPNRVHHLYVKPYFAAYPDAFVYGAPGLAEKRRDLGFHNKLGDRPRPEWAAELEQHAVGGAPLMSEIAFLHKASRTLILTDLLFNFPASKPSDDWRRRVFLRLDDCDGRLCVSRLARWCVRDRGALRRSYDRILAWDFDRIVMAHGDVAESGGKEKFRAAFGWL